VKIAESESVVLEGVLIPVGWGPSGQVLDVGLMTFDEDEYPIDAAVALDHRLREHVRKRVRLSTIIREGRVIRLTRVEFLGTEDFAPSRGEPF
jgi:hypothetical protein